MAWTAADISFKRLLNKRQSSSTKQFYEEFGDYTINMYSEEIWFDHIPSDASSLAGVIQWYNLHTLKVDPTVPSNLTWVAVTTPAAAFNFSLSDDPTNPRLKDWISDKFGNSYDLTLWSNGTQIAKTSTAYPWIFNYATGELTFNTAVPATPIQIKAYRYIGRKGPVGIFLQEASLGPDFVWDSSGYLDVSILAMDYTYIDGSLAARDVSIAYIANTYIPNASLSNDFVWNASNYLEVSLGAVYGLDQLIRSASVGDTLFWDGSVFNVSEGLYVKEVSLGNQFIWDPCGNLTVDISAISAYTTSLDPALTMPYAVGGIPANTSVGALYGDTFIQLFDDLLFPTVNPTLTGPSASMTIGPAVYLYEVSSNQTLTFTSTLNRGSINPQYTAASPYRSGLPNYFNFTGIGLIDDASNSIPYVSPSFDISIGLTQSWYVVINYDQGVQPYNSKGQIYDVSLAAGSTSNSNTITIEGTYPYFATTNNITTLDKQLPLVVLSTNPSPVMNLVTEVDLTNRQTFEIPNAILALHALVGVQWYNTNNNAWEYIGPDKTAVQSLTYWTTSSVTKNVPTGSEYNVPYTRYTNNDVKTGARQIRLIF